MKEFSVALVEKSPKSSGMAATFVRINEEWGIKYWPDHKRHFCGGDYVTADIIRDEEHRKLNFASKHGLAPKVGEKIEFELSERTYYGFFVEIIKYTYNDRVMTIGDVPRYVNQSDYTYDYSKSGDEDTGLIDIATELLNIGFTDVGDLHVDNVGFMPDDSFVVIDLGHCSLPSELE
jgi:hypothetical protein